MLIRAVLPALLAVTLTACGDDRSPTVPAPAPPGASQTPEPQPSPG